MTTRSDNGNQRSHGYPRPMLQRADWISLNGNWDFALDPTAQWKEPNDVEWNATITVPFAPETPASGIADTGFYRSCWYQRTFHPPALASNQRLLLHFGAVDYQATVWVNGYRVAQHEGGYTPFSADITECLTGPGPQTIVVRAEDDPAELAKPRGKQDWQLEPHSIWYPRTTGIWQTVWLERVPATWIGYVGFTPVLERWEIGIQARLEGERREGLRLNVKLRFREQLIADDTYTVIAGEVHRRIAFSDPGIDDYRNELLWKPSAPNLINVEMTLWSGRGELLDKVQSYTALRSMGVQSDRFLLNGRPYPLRLVLDQGYWPETGLTAPDDEALRRDVELARMMGFNGVRKHQKIEDPRYLYWADVMGLLVWEEMPSAYRYTKLSIERLTREWLKVIERDSSHPCIIAWVPFNESWGVPDLPDNPAQRHYVQALYHLTKTLDPTRPVVGNDGWESVATDIIGIHDYDDDPERLTRRYGADEVLPRLFKRERPGGRLLLLDEQAHTGQPIMLSEFGGVAFSPNPNHWGHSRSDTQEEYAAKVTAILEAVRSLNLLAGFCFTQFADTYQEANGLLLPDRMPKFPIEDIALAVLGPRDLESEWLWRERLMEQQRNQYVVPQEDYRTH
ncbi:MAG: glycoside hydrolase family 2 [Acidobacteria bacterium]|nr:glycoside hydrolase family 2 [Acidobacteriota bacterium]